MPTAPPDSSDPAAHTRLRPSGSPAIPPPSQDCAPRTAPPACPPLRHAFSGGAPVDWLGRSAAHSSDALLRTPLPWLRDCAPPALQTAHARIARVDTPPASHSTAPAAHAAPAQAG